MSTRMRFLFIILMPYVAFGQQSILGKYCTTQNFGGFCLDFRTSDSVIYHHWDCLNRYDQTGIYRIVDDSLYIHFELTDKIHNLSENSISHLSDMDCEGDSVLISILVREKLSQTELPLATIRIDDEGNTEKHNFCSRTCNLDGALEIKLPRAEHKINLTASYVATDQNSIEILLNKCYDVIFELVERDPMEFRLDSLNFRIKYFSENEIWFIERGEDQIIVLRKSK